MSKINLSAIKNKLIEVIDPELNISIVDLGLVYKIYVKHPRGGRTDSSGGVVINILMTLTTIGCPLFDLIETEVKRKLKELGLKEKDIKLELTFDPPWTMEKLSKRGRAMLGI